MELQRFSRFRKKSLLFSITTAVLFYVMFITVAVKQSTNLVNELQGSQAADSEADSVSHLSKTTTTPMTTTKSDLVELDSMKRSSTQSSSTDSVPTTTTTFNLDEFICDFKLKEQPSYTDPNHPCEKLRCTVIIRNLSGRLGNRMFFFASAYGIARTHHCHLHVSRGIMKELRSNFLMSNLDNTTFHDNDDIVPAFKDLPQYDSGCTYFPLLMQPRAFRNIELIGYWQSYLYFDAYRNDLQKIFTARLETVDRLAAYFTKLMSVECPSCPPLTNRSHQDLREQFRTMYNITWIGIHVRRTDFRPLGYSSGDEYLFKAINHYRRRYHNKKLRFIVASDDKVYCNRTFRSEIEKRNVFVLPEHNLVIDDLIALTLCHHSIITSGTFGFWTAYLAGGNVIHDSQYGTDCRHTDYYPPWFIIVGRTKPNNFTVKWPEKQFLLE